jgi:hypothetical protein
MLTFGLAALGSPAWASAAPIAAPQQSDVECRCVDRDGNAIADCTCLRTPRFENMMPLIGFSRPRLGISVSTDQGDELDAQGARVTNVLEDGPAWDAGIREGDVITRIDGQSLFEPLPGDAEDDFDLDESVPVQRLLATARELEPGQEVEVTYLRDGVQRTTTVSAEELSGRSFNLLVPELDAERMRQEMRRLERDLDGLRGFQWRSREPGEFDVRIFDGTPGATFFGTPGATLGLARYGLELVQLNQGLGQYFGTTEGVLVVDAAEDSTLGIEAGDVILSIGGRAATTPAQVVRILGSYDDDEDISIRVRRDGREVEVLGRVEG